MDSNYHVYCVDCKWFRLDDEEIPYCPFEDTCDINNCEDSVPFKNRPNYEMKDIPKFKNGDEVIMYPNNEIKTVQLVEMDMNTFRYISSHCYEVDMELIKE